MHPIALTIAALICYAGSLAAHPASSARHTLIEEPESPSHAIALEDHLQSPIALQGARARV